MAKLKGKNLAVMRLVNGKYKVIGMSTSCTIDLDTEMVEMAGRAAGFREYIAGKHNMTIQCECMVDSQPIASGHVPWMQLQLNRGRVSFAVATAEGGTAYGVALEGEGIVSHQSLTGSVDGYATHSITIQCTGEITYTNMSQTAAISEEEA